MQYHKDLLRASIILLFCLLNVGIGLYAHQPMMMSGGLVGMCYVTLMAFDKTGEQKTTAAPLVEAVE